MKSAQTAAHLIIYVIKIAEEKERVRGRIHEVKAQRKTPPGGIYLNLN